MAVSVLINQFEQHLVLFLEGLHLTINFLLRILELIGSSIIIVQIPIQLLLGFFWFKWIELLIGARLVPAIRALFIIAYHTVTLDESMARGILMLTISGVRISYLVRNSRDCFSVIIIPTRLLSLILLCGGLMGFAIRANPVVFGF